MIPRGLFSWNGATWRQLAVVCGGSGDTTRIAWAGPTEFWVISGPSRPRIGDGIALCHFKDGQVVASYGTLPNAADPYQVMNAATCAAANDCWFGGPAAADPTGGRSGAFRLHWDGQSLTTSYGPQGRGITDLAPFGGTIFESVLVGPAPEVRDAPQNREPESAPRLLHRLEGTVFESDPFEPAPRAASRRTVPSCSGSTPATGGCGRSEGEPPPVPTSRRAASSTARRWWRRAARARATSHELALNAPAGTFSAGDRFSDVAAIPGTSDGLGRRCSPSPTVQSVNAKARIALIDAATGQVTRAAAAGVRRRGAGLRRGSPARRRTTAGSRPTAAGCSTTATGRAEPVDNDPAFANLITFRPNEAAAQFVPDTPPVDDSLLLAPPPVEVQPAASRRRRRR